MPEVTTPTAVVPPNPADTTPITKTTVKDSTNSVLAAIMGVPKIKEQVPSNTPVQVVSAPQVQSITKPDASVTPQIPDTLFAKGKPKASEKSPEVVAVKPSEDFDPDTVRVEDLPEASRANFARLRDKYHGTAKERDEIRKENEALKAKQVDPAQSEAFKKLQAERDQAWDTAAKVKLEADPRFVAKYNQQQAPIVSTVKGILSSYDVKDMKVDEVVAHLVTLPTKMRAEFLASQLPDEVTPSAIATVLPMMAQIDLIENTRKSELENHRQTVALLEKQEMDKHQETTIAMRESVKRSAMDDLAKEEILLQHVDGNPEWNKTVDALRLSVETLFQAGDPKIHAKALIESRMTPVYKAMFFAERERREQLESTLKARNIALPGIGTTANSSGGSSQTLRGPMTAEQAVKNISARIRGV